jgi:dihydroorotase
MSRIVIQGARLIDLDGEHGVRDLYLKDGLVEGFDLGGEVDASIQADGCVVTPAFIDLHTHLRVPGGEVKEDLASGLTAAVAGGYGTVVSMANTTPVIDDPGLVAELIGKAEALGLARLRPSAALSKNLEGERLTDFAALQAAGAVMITDDGVPVADGHLMRRACEYARELGLVIQTHTEEPTLRQGGVMNEGEVSVRLGLPGNPVAAETVMIFRDCEISRMTGARVHIAHVSSARGMQVVEWFKAQGAPVSCEVTPHHLTLSDEALATFDPIFKVAPPLRTDADVSALKDAVARGVVDCIATDHAPHTRAEKELDMLEAPFGIANIEVAFALLYTRLVREGGLELPQLLHLFQRGPAEVMGWPAPRLAPGEAADVTVLDLGRERPVEAKRFKSKARFSPWDGEELFGWPVATFVRGRQVFARKD